jgi:hypothetical protein
MKYVKTYEKIIAAKSEEARRNPLYDFSGKIAQILKTFKYEDSIFSTTKRYIEDDGYITIKIANFLFKIILDYDERLDKGTMVIRASFVFKSIENVFNFMSTQLDSYVADKNLKDKYLRFNFSLDDTADIIRLLEEYYHYITAKKFNI